MNKKEDLVVQKPCQPLVVFAACPPLGPAREKLEEVEDKEQEDEVATAIRATTTAPSAPGGRRQGEEVSPRHCSFSPLPSFLFREYRTFFLFLSPFPHDFPGLPPRGRG